eukprot:3589712-Rhodomonas_salina.5
MRLSTARHHAHRRHRVGPATATVADPAAPTTSVERSQEQETKRIALARALTSDTTSTAALLRAYRSVANTPVSTRVLLLGHGGSRFEDCVLNAVTLFAWSLTRWLSRLQCCEHEVAQNRHERLRSS